MLSELARDDVPDMELLMAMRPVTIPAAERRLIGIDGPATPGETVGGYCSAMGLPHQLVAARLVRYLRPE